MDEITYTLKEKDENFKLSKIEKRGEVVTFTLEDVEANERKINKLLDEKKAQKSIEDAKMQNVLNNHPEIGEMPEVKRRAAFIYEDALIASTELAKVIEAGEKFIAESEKEKKAIMEALGFIPSDNATA